MVEPVIPAGVTAAALIISALGWYGMLRTGVEFVHNDNYARKHYGEEIISTWATVSDYESKMQHWKDEWYISEHTNDATLRMIWGDKGFENIMIQWKIIQRILNDLREGLRESMGSAIVHLIRKQKNQSMDLDLAQWANWSVERTQWAKLPAETKRRKVKYIWAHRKHFQSELGKLDKLLLEIENRARRGWQRQQSELFPASDCPEVYHVQKIYDLLRITDRLGGDFNQLCKYLHELGGIFVELDLDIFDAFSAKLKVDESARVAALAATNHLKLGLLIWKDPGPNGIPIVTEASIEKATDSSDEYCDPGSAFETALRSAVGSRVCFGRQTKFSLSKKMRSCASPEHKDKLNWMLSASLLPFFDTDPLSLNPSGLQLKAFSTFQLCHELAQACLLFLRTELFAKLCGCQILLGHIREDSHGSRRIRYEYSILLAPKTPHVKDVSWCQCRMNLGSFTQPIRQLGLLLLEIILTTRIVGVRLGSMQEISHVTILTRLHQQPRPSDPQSTKGTVLTRAHALELVAKALKSEDDEITEVEIKRVKKAIDYCLICEYSQAPVDLEWKSALHDLYLDVVQPLRDVYARLLEKHISRRAGLPMTGR